MHESLKQSSSIVIAIISIFIPLLYLLFKDADFIIQIFSYAIICSVIFCVVYLLIIIFYTPLSRGIKPDEYEKLINTKLKEVLKSEIAYNNDSYNRNLKVFENIRKKFNLAITILIISVTLCLFLIFINKVYNYNKPPIKIEIKK
jgi:hypothetical protein